MRRRHSNGFEGFLSKYINCYEVSSELGLDVEEVRKILESRRVRFLLSNNKVKLDVLAHPFTEELFLSRDSLRAILARLPIDGESNGRIVVHKPELSINGEAFIGVREDVYPELVAKLYHRDDVLPYCEGSNVRLYTRKEFEKTFTLHRLESKEDLIVLK